MTDELIGNWLMLHTELLFLTFIQLDFPLIGAPKAGDFSTHCAVNTKFMNPLWLEGAMVQGIFTSNKTIRITKGSYIGQSLFGC